MNWWWTVHEHLFMWTFQELLMNCSWTIFFHNKFLNSSWTVMVNCSWTLVHEPTMRVFYELFMNCSWMFMNVHERFIKSWTTFHRGLELFSFKIFNMWSTMSVSTMSVSSSFTNILGRSMTGYISKSGRQILEDIPWNSLTIYSRPHVKQVNFGHSC